MAVIAAISAMRLLAVWTIWFIRQKSCCAVTEIHHDPRTDRDLFPDYLCWYGNISLATLPVIAEVAKEQGVNLAVRCLLQWYPRRLRSPHANLSGSGLHVFRDGRSWHQLLHLLSVVIPSTLLAVLVMSSWSPCCSTPNSLTIRFIASVGRGPG